MEVTLVTPKKELFKGKASSITLRGAKGEMQILPNHAPMLATLSTGKVIIEGPSGSKEFEISSGFVEVHENMVTLLANNKDEP